VRRPLPEEMKAIQAGHGYSHPARSFHLLKYELLHAASNFVKLSLQFRALSFESGTTFHSLRSGGPLHTPSPMTPSTRARRRAGPIVII
jgi:hypothetical protein